MIAKTDRQEGRGGARVGNSTGDCYGPVASGVEGRFASLIVVPDEAMAMKASTSLRSSSVEYYSSYLAPTRGHHAVASINHDDKNEI